MILRNRNSALLHTVSHRDLIRRTESSPVRNIRLLSQSLAYPGYRSYRHIARRGNNKIRLILKSSFKHSLSVYCADFQKLICILNSDSLWIIVQNINEQSFFFRFQYSRYLQPACSQDKDRFHNKLLLTLTI